MTGQLFTKVAGRDHRRHLLHGTGTAAFPRALCHESVVLRDDPLLMACTDCTVKALAEVSVALDILGLTDLAVLVTRHVGDLSFETRKAQTDMDQVGLAG